MCLSHSESLKSTQKHNSKTTIINPTLLLLYARQATLGKHTTADPKRRRRHKLHVVLTPTERHCTRPVGSLLDQRLVELAARRRVNSCPARLAVILQTGHVGTEERRELSAAVDAGTLVTDLIVENIRFHLNLAT